MARIGEKRQQPADSVTGCSDASTSGQFPDIPLDLAAPKRFRFMIDHLLNFDDDEKTEKQQMPPKGHDDDDSGPGSVEPEECGSGIASGTEQTLKTSPPAGNSQLLQHVTCRLEGRELWSKFYELSTEMI
ncbi:unnamed protein product, partial [Gongylonema pulchrum]|uniref:T-box transcription factor tbx20 n=1 Tax=Gongylonema pulchrum TaxID=637853 RepID=A0A183DLH4_9BILA